MLYDDAHVQYHTTSGYIQVVTDGHNLPAFWAHPEAGGRYPGLVVLHDEYGLTSRARVWVRRFAEMGFYVIAPDLYDGQIAADAAQAHALREQLGEAGPPRVSAALEVIKAHHRCTGKMGVVGWGMGGELAYHAAAYRDDILAAVIFYGDPGAFLTILPANETPLLAFYGDDDADIPPAMLNRLSQAMSISPAAEHLVIFPGVANGFLDEESPHYHPQYAARAWKHMIGFLYEHLGAAPSASQEHDPLG